MPSSSPVSIVNLSFQYASAVEPLFDQLSTHFNPGFTGIVGANGTGKTTLLQLVTGALLADEGHIVMPESSVYCSQRTDDPPSVLEDFLFDDDPATYSVQSRLKLDASFLYRWDSLSHGERKRAQIACALWQKPELLALDEPTNHIDQDARATLLTELKQFNGIGLLVSHDRELLDALCSQCLWLGETQPKLYEGGYSKALAQRELDRISVFRSRQQVKKETNRLHREVIQRRDKAAISDKLRSKRGIAAKDHDAKSKKDLARVSGKDGQAGKLMNQMSGRLAHAEEKLSSAAVEKQYETGIWLPGSCSSNSHLLHMAAGKLMLSEHHQLQHPTLEIHATDHIAITGLNGTGKSTLIQRLLDKLTLPAERIVYLPQEITAEDSKEILHDIKSLDHEQLGQVMTIVSRLGSRPHRLLDSATPSPGELRKLLLAKGMTQSPYLIVMDEPTNHLDLPSIVALEAALAECPCALLLVSHDQTLLNRLCDTHWQLTQTDRSKTKLATHYRPA